MTWNCLVAVSAFTGEGMDDLLKAIGECVDVYKQDYVPMYNKLMNDKKQLDEAEKKRKVDEVGLIFFSDFWKILWQYQI